MENKTNELIKLIETDNNLYESSEKIKTNELIELIKTDNNLYESIEKIFQFIRQNNIAIDNKIATKIWWRLRNLMFMHSDIVSKYLDIYTKIIEQYPVLDNDYDYNNNLNAIQTKFSSNINDDRKYFLLLLIKDEKKLLKYFKAQNFTEIINVIYEQSKNIDKDIELKIFDSLFETFSVEAIISIIDTISSNNTLTFEKEKIEYYKKFLRHFIDTYYKTYETNSDKLLAIIYSLETERKNIFLKLASNNVKYELFKDDLYIPTSYEEILELAQYSIKNEQKDFLELTLDKCLIKKLIKNSLIEEFLENKGTYSKIIIDNFVEHFDITFNVIENIIKLFEQSRKQPIYTNLIPDILCKYIENVIIKYNKQILKNNNEEEKFVDLITDIFFEGLNLNRLCNNYGIINGAKFYTTLELLDTNYKNTEYEYFGIIFAIINGHFGYNFEKQKASFDFNIYTFKEKNLECIGLLKHENGQNYVEKIDDFEYQENEIKEEKINNEIYAEVGENIENRIKNKIIQTKFCDQDIKVTKIGSVSKDLQVIIEENIDLILFDNNLQLINEVLEKEISQDLEMFI